MLTTRRPQAVLVPFIKKWVAEDSILISDGWQGYGNELKDYYLHECVIHEHEFAHVVVIDGVEINVNTNHIEREWVEIRKIMKCISPEFYEERLRKEVFRLLYLAGKDDVEKPFIFMEKMAQLRN
mgnify:CR=1 FL=1